MSGLPRPLAGVVAELVANLGEERLTLATWIRRRFELGRMARIAVRIGADVGGVLLQARLRSLGNRIVDLVEDALKREPLVTRRAT